MLGAAPGGVCHLWLRLSTPGKESPVWAGSFYLR